MTTVSTSAPSTTAPAVPTTGVPTGDVAGFPLLDVSLDGRPVTVAVAASPALQRKGLMGVTDLGSLAGMWFVFDSDVTAGFWMKDTLIPLDIAFFDAGGVAVRVMTMQPCTADPCPTYSPGIPYRSALEVPAGTLALHPGSTIRTLP